MLSKVARSQATVGNLRKPHGQTLRVFTAFLCVGGFGEICQESASLSPIFFMSCLLRQDCSPHVSPLHLLNGHSPLAVPPLPPGRTRDLVESNCAAGPRMSLYPQAVNAALGIEVPEYIPVHRAMNELWGWRPQNRSLSIRP